MPGSSYLRKLLIVLASASLLWSCSGDSGSQGLPGSDGTPGADGADGADGPAGEPGATPIDPEAPLSSMVALSFRDGGQTGADNIADYVKALLELYASDAVPAGTQFPLAAAATDSLRAIKGLHPSTVIRWLEPITFAGGAQAPRFGANADFIAYFGDGWDEGAGSPYFTGDDTAGWVWVNHEYISNSPPTATSAPTGQHVSLARFLRYMRVLTNVVDADIWDDASLIAYIEMYKKQLGGSWMRVIQNPATGDWEVDLNAENRRYDATSTTRLRLAGISQSAPDHDDAGEPLPEGVVAGIMGDCSGGQTPWGTIITAEENVQDYYGDLEAAWTSSQKFVTGTGFDPGQAITFPFEASGSSDFGASPDPNASHNRDFYGYLAEMDPGVTPGEYDGMMTPGVGHKKLGAMGRARWENATFVVDSNRELISGQPIIIYSGNDRRGGGIYKLVTSAPYEAGMSRAEIRALLDEGTLYVAHFAGLDNTTGNTLLATGAAPTEAAPGAGRWIELSTSSEDIAPNAAALGEGARTVGAALTDVSWNGIGGFTSDDEVRWALFTASNKIGVMELNRPEDLEWNPRDPSGVPRLYVAFTNHGRQVALDQDGVLYDPETHDMVAPTRPDRVGAIFVIEEAEPASAADSTTFSFFEIWHGSEGPGVFDAANPDNIFLDAQGGVWFGTDGNFSVNGKADSLYYLDLNPAHQDTPVPTYGRAFRIAATPSDAEATGPAWSADMGTLFMAVQHPGEGVFSSWPERRPVGPTQ